MLGEGRRGSPDDHATEEAPLAHLPPYPDRGDETDARPDRGPATGAPRWVSKVGIVVAVGLILLVVVLHLTGTIGPGAH
jgi:hypothetical protein